MSRNNVPKGSRLSRREFLKLMGIGGVASMLAGWSGYAYASEIEPSLVDVVPVSVEMLRLPVAFDNLRIVQISDIHMGGWMNAERLQRVVDLVLRQQPDVIAMTGDFLLGYDWSAEMQVFVDEMQEIFTPMAANALTVAVLGNHDHWTKPKAIRRMFTASGIHDLSNHVIDIEKNGSRLHLCGVDDVWVKKNDLDLVLMKLPKEGAAILLAHEPDFADSSAVTGRFDLQLSGHSHGGQVVLPVIGPPVLPLLGKKYPAGLYRVGDMWQYTNRGVGMSNPAIRFNCRPEITVLQLQAG